MSGERESMRARFDEAVASGALGPGPFDGSLESLDGVEHSLVAAYRDPSSLPRLGDPSWLDDRRRASIVDEMPTGVPAVVDAAAWVVGDVQVRQATSVGCRWAVGTFGRSTGQVVLTDDASRFESDPVSLVWGEVFDITHGRAEPGALRRKVEKVLAIRLRTPREELEQAWSGFTPWESWVLAAPTRGLLRRSRDRIPADTARAVVADLVGRPGEASTAEDVLEQFDPGAGWWTIGVRAAIADDGADRIEVRVLGGPEDDQVGPDAALEDYRQRVASVAARHGLDVEHTPH